MLVPLKRLLHQSPYTVANRYFTRLSRSLWARSLPAYFSPAMSPKSLPSEFPTQAFATCADFEAYLEREHATSPGVYLKFAKKKSGIPSISGAEAVEVALCYGWIDGRANTIDDDWWTVRYTPRRAKSIWSQKNVGTVARLIEESRMRPAGLAAVEAAKADGRWQRAYSGPATIAVPEDLTRALAGNPSADAFWRSLNKSERYATLHRIETASNAVRGNKIAAMVQMLAAGQQPGANTPAAAKAKPKQKVGVRKAPRKAAAGEQARPRRSGLRSQMK